MQISTNNTGLPAELCVATDKHGRDYCVAVIKGTFTVNARGETGPAEAQAPLVSADLPFGDPASTSIRYECEFAPVKPKIDILLNARAMSPNGKPVSDILVGVKVGSMRKVLRVTGERRWENGLSGLRPTPPEPFLEMPITYERAFGGSDHSHPEQEKQGSELRNPVGVGFRMNPDAASARGLSMPNVEAPDAPMRAWNDRATPVGFGAVGRGWQPRIRHAGTYDRRWLDERFPFLPEDFDDHYFQSAPADQQMAAPIAGEAVHCVNLSPGGSLQFVIPTVAVPVVFRFRDRDEQVAPPLDTLIIEPDQRRFLLLWRARVRLGRKLNALREVLVGKDAKSGLLLPD